MEQNVKQVIVMRKDLNMRKGKMIAQGSHASMAFLTKYCNVGQYSIRIDYENIKNISHDELETWLKGSFKKVCLYVESEKELQEIHDKAWAVGLHSTMITDSGLTEFNGVPTKTCIAIGPHIAEKIDKITGHLKLL